MKKSQTLDLDLISKEKDSKPYWNEQLGAKCSTLWFPTKTDLQELDTTSLCGSLKGMAGLSHVLTSLTTNQNSTTTTLSPLSQFSATPITVKKQVVTRKIRIYPKNVGKYISLCHLSRYCYNSMIHYRKNYEEYDQKIKYRKIIANKTKEWDNYSSHVVSEACRNADKTAKAIIKKRKNGQACDFRFKSRKSTRQGFDIQFLPKKWIYPRYLGEVHFTEQIPEYAYGKSARVILENNEWYLCCYDLIQIDENQVNVKSNAVALDPGVRTFLAGYSPNTVFEIGKSFIKNKIMPQLLKLDKYYSDRAKLKECMDEDEGFNYQWYKDRFWFLDKKIKKLRARINHLKEDLHKKSAYFLVKNFDVILIPTFEVTNMVKKSNKLHSKVTRAMLNLGHYRFKQHLMWMAKKYGKMVFECNESYTSKTNPFNGDQMDIGARKTFKHNEKTYDRDVNGARNIFIKNLIR